nr:hypothetical protein Iba_chr03bCG2560 [Ipomoea batatas]
MYQQEPNQVGSGGLAAAQHRGGLAAAQHRCGLASGEAVGLSTVRAGPEVVAASASSQGRRWQHNVDGGVDGYGGGGGSWFRLHRRRRVGSIAAVALLGERGVVFLPFRLPRSTSPKAEAGRRATAACGGDSRKPLLRSQRAGGAEQRGTLAVHLSPLGVGVAARRGLDSSSDGSTARPNGVSCSSPSYPRHTFGTTPGGYVVHCMRSSS